MQAHVGPHRQLVRGQKPKRAFPIAVDGEGAQGGCDLRSVDPARQAHGTEMVPMQALGETPQHWLPGIGGDALDDELVPGHAKRYALAVLQEAAGPTHHRPRRGLERRVTRGVHRMLMQCNGEIDEELAELARERRPFGNWRNLAHTLAAYCSGRAQSSVVTIRDDAGCADGEGTS